jgi:hypothetical protein
VPFTVALFVKVRAPIPLKVGTCALNVMVCDCPGASTTFASVPNVSVCWPFEPVAMDGLPTLELLLT